MKLHMLTAVALSASLALAPNLFAATHQEDQKKEKQETLQQEKQDVKEEKQELSQKKDQKQQMTDQEQQQKQQQTGQEQPKMAAGQQKQDQYAQQLQNSDDIQGMKIQNQQGEEVGSIDKVVIDTQAGQVAYVVLTSGGFWGIGGEKVVVPWNALKMQPTEQAQAGQQGPVLVLNVTKDQLKQAPQGDLKKTLDRNQGREIHQYYGVSPYWEGQQQQK